MNTTDRHIIHLLVDKGHVDIPEVGSLNVRRIPAYFDGKVLKSPGFITDFDSDSRMCDSDHLITSIRREKNIDSAEAENILVSDIESVRSDISAGEKHSLDSIGYFEDKGKGIEFTPMSTLHPLSFGYPSIELSPITKERHNKENIPLYAQSEEKREEFIRSLRRAASSAAAVAIVAVLAYVIALIPNRNSTTNQASVILEQDQPQVVKIANPESSAKESALVLVFNTPADASCDVEKPESNTSVDVAAVDSENNSAASDVINVVQDKEAQYCLVVASLSSETEAKEFIANTDKSLSLLCKDGRFRVYAMDGSSFESLYKAAAESGLLDRYPNAWICKR